jgi:hypothetical protein
MTILPAWIIDHENRKGREREREQELLRLPNHPPKPPREPSEDKLAYR